MSAILIHPLTTFVFRLELESRTRDFIIMNRLDRNYSTVKGPFLELIITAENNTLNGSKNLMFGQNKLIFTHLSTGT